MGPLRPGHRHAVAAGMTLMLLGYFAFALNDALGKYLVESFGVAQVVAIRAFGGLLILGPLLGYARERPWRGVQRPALQVLRVLFVTLDTVLFYAACVYLPLADVLTFYMAGPIYTLVASHLFLGERIGWRRWAAILVGFAGVLIALRPSSASFSPSALYAIAGSVSYSLALVLNRILARTPDATLGLYQTLGALVGAGAFSVLDWRPLTVPGASYMLLLGIGGILAHLMVIRASRLAPVSLLAQLQYTLLLWGIIMGVAFFGDVPGPNVILGSAVIVVAGLFIFRREERLAGPSRTAETTVNTP